MPRESTRKKATPSSQVSPDTRNEQTGNQTGFQTKDPFEEVLKSIDTSWPVTVDLIVALLKAQESSLRTFFEVKLAVKDEEILKLREKNQQLEDKLDDLEQYSRRNSIRITGIEENTDVTQFLANKLDVDVGNHIERYHPVGKRREDGKPRPLLVKFLNYHSRSAVLKNRSKLKGAGVFINEDLTKCRNLIASKCRALKKDHKIKNTWIRDGTIFIKMDDESVNRISTLHQLHGFVSPRP